jgi:hypothetical protein
MMLRFLTNNCVIVNSLLSLQVNLEVHSGYVFTSSIRV